MLRETLKASFTQVTNRRQIYHRQSHDSMFALASMKLFTQCCCRPITDFSHCETATGRGLMSDFFVASTPSLHINEWSFSHKSHFLRHSKLIKLYIWCISQ